MNVGPLTAKNKTIILPTLQKFCVLLHCRASHTQFSRQNSTKLCHTVGGKPRQQTAVTKFWVFHPAKNWGPKCGPIVDDIATQWQSGVKLDRDNRKKALEATKGSLRGVKIEVW